VSAQPRDVLALAEPGIPSRDGHRDPQGRCDCLPRRPDLPVDQVSGEGIVADQCVITASAGQQEALLSAFVPALVKMRHWERAVDAVPA